MSSQQHQARNAAIYSALAQIPTGKVITYGQLAALAGIPNGARIIGKVLCNLPEKSELPWHRVINAQGKISLPVDSESYREQLKRLQEEGIAIINGKINLKFYSW